MHRNKEIKLHEDGNCCIYFDKQDVTQLRRVVEHICDIQPYHINPALHEFRKILSEVHSEHRRRVLWEKAI